MFHQYQRRRTPPPLTRSNGGPTHVRRPSNGPFGNKTRLLVSAQVLPPEDKTPSLGLLLWSKTSEGTHAGTSDEDPRQTVSCLLGTGSDFSERVESELAWIEGPLESGRSSKRLAYVLLFQLNSVRWYGYQPRYRWRN